MKIIFRQLLFCAVSLASLSLNAQITSNPAQEDTTIRYYSRLAASTNEADRAYLETQLYKILKSDKETDWLLAQRFFYQIKKQKTADSIIVACRVSFPLGQIVRGDETKVIYDETNPVKKEAMYKAWIKKFPPEKFGTDRIQYDYVRNDVASAYAEADNVSKAVQYANMIETQTWKGEGWAGPATRLQKNGHLNEAAELFKKASANSYKYLTSNRNEPGARFAAIGFSSYTSSLAQIYFEQKKYAEALKHIKLAHDSSKSVKAYINSTYADVLIALKKDKEAFDIINEAITAGQASTNIRDRFKQLYVKVKGSNEGYDEYMTTVNKILAENIRKDLQRRILNKPAASFTLKDADGNTYSLEQFKGKTIILDFWATWCGPCKRSFPAMRTAQNKYADDTTVKFLFIHTWEREDNATTNAKKYVTDNNLPFTVLMDLKDNDTKINTVADKYNVSSIPAKVVIDKNGIIRFMFNGFTDEEAAVEEIVAMIELAEKSK